MVWTAGRYLSRMHARTMHSTSGVCVCCLASNGTNLYEWWCTEANEATQTHCYNPVAPSYPIWAYYAHGRQRRCQEDPVSVSLPSGGLEKTTRSSLHHVAQHRPKGSEKHHLTLSEAADLAQPPSVEDDVDVWATISQSCMPETTTTMLHDNSNAGSVIACVSEMWYLDVYLTWARLFTCSLDHAKRSFYNAANTIFSKIGRIASEEIVLQLVKSKCIPFYYTA